MSASDAEGRRFKSYHPDHVHFCSPKHRKALDKIEGKLAVEASPYDRVWGIGMKKGDPGIEDPKNWRGTNLLGICVTETGEIFRQHYDEAFFQWMTD